MRKAALLFNPDSGASSKRRNSQLQAVLVLLQAANVEASLIIGDSPRHATEQAKQAVASGCDTIFACGGDGTIHNIIQVLAMSPVALAILPMGTANALAHDLGLPSNLVAAARVALNGVARRVALGRVQYQNLEGQSAARYFVIAAGLGVDAHLFYKLHSGLKQRMGMSAYYAKAWHLWFSYPMTRFLVEYAEIGSTEPKQANVTELLAVRIRNFGGVLQELAPGASLDRNDLRVILCRTASRLAYVSHVARSLVGGKWTIPGIELAHSTKVSCRYLSESARQDTPTPARPRIYVEADGELLGTLPAEMTVQSDALTILAPAARCGGTKRCFASFGKSASK
jgi:YegS/Rv2252/BmrU family lipid kinase